MIILVLGTPSSGKSEIAEELVLQLSSPEDRIYLATMIAYDHEGRERIIKHRLRREGKGFITIEKAYRVDEIADKLHNCEDKTVLLECMSNLTGNEMYENPERKGLSVDELADRIVDDVHRLNDSVSNLIIVSNHFDEPDEADDDTKRYIQLTDAVNDRLKLICDRIEIVG